MSEPNLVEKWSAWSPQLRSVFRIAAALPFIVAGTVILFSFPDPMPQGASAPVLSQIWIGGVLELVGGSLILIGLFTRPVAFILSGMMAVAYFQYHVVPFGFWPHRNHGIPALLYCFIWLYISAAGPGPWSLDASRGKSKSWY